MKKILIISGLVILGLFLVACARQGDESAFVGNAKALPPILKPTCTYLLQPAGSFKLTKELTLEQGVYGNPSLFADEFNENELTKGCLGIYNVRSCNTLDYVDSSSYFNSPFVQVAIVKLPAQVTNTTISKMLENTPFNNNEFLIKPANKNGKINNVWNSNSHFLWVSGDLLIEIVGPLAQVDWSLLDSYYQKYPPIN